MPDAPRTPHVPLRLAVALLAIALPAAACAPAPAGPTHQPAQPQQHPNQAVAPAPERPLPLMAGTAWEYRAPDGRYATLSVRSRLDAGVDFEAIGAVAFTATAIAPNDSGRDGLALASFSTPAPDRSAFITPPISLLPDPTRLEIGQQFSGQHLLDWRPGTTEAIEVRASVATRQMLSTPLGVLDAFLVRYEVTSDDFDSLVAGTYDLWIAPYIGIVAWSDDLLLDDIRIRRVR